MTMNYSYRYILKLAAPLILTMSSHMLMQFVDALLLSWYSAEAVAAVIPAGMVHWLILCAFHGTAGYVSTFVAQFRGAGRRDEISPAVWQALYFSIIAGALIALLAPLGGPLFRLVGHEPSLVRIESRYFGILCLGSPFSLLAVSINGFFSGREQTRVILYVQVLGAAVNMGLDYLLIFGKAGFPALGPDGAALATVCGQAVMFAAFALLFFRSRTRREFDTWNKRRFDRELFLRLIRFGFPSGVRFAVEMTAWTAFLLFVGRVGTIELTATNIAWRINGIAFFPVIGLAQAAGILIGNAQGRRNPVLSSKITWRALLLAEIWTAAAGLLFVLFPGRLYGLFFREGAMSAAMFLKVSGTGVILLRFVALYVLFDTFNIIFLTTLQSAGDTRWTFFAAGIGHALFIAALTGADTLKAGIFTEWAFATAFVILQGLVWLARFRAGKWRSMRVIGEEDLQ
jgi:MATE family multidrug resistance protein